MNEPRPARRVDSCVRARAVRRPASLRRVDGFGMVLAELSDRISHRRRGWRGEIPWPDGEAGRDWAGRASGGRAWRASSNEPVVRCRRARRFGYHVRTSGNLLRWTQSCPRTGGALHARPQVAPGRGGAQDGSIPCEPLNVRIEDEDGPTVFPDHLQGAVAASRRFDLPSESIENDSPVREQLERLDAARPIHLPSPGQGCGRGVCWGTREKHANRDDRGNREMPVTGLTDIKTIKNRCSAPQPGARGTFKRTISPRTMRQTGRRRCRGS